MSKSSGPVLKVHRPHLELFCVCAVPGPPASLEFESPTEKSLILSWSPPAETNGVLQGYIVQYQQGEV